MTHGTNLNSVGSGGPVGPMVVKLGGAALNAPSEQTALWEALRTLHAEHAGGLILVHGGGNAVDLHLSRLGFATERIEGLRVTPPEQIGEVVAVLAGSVNKTLVGAINNGGEAKAVGMCLGDGGLTVSQKLNHRAGDLGRVGEIVGGDATVAQSLLKAGFMPVIASIGIDAEGDPLNINADDAATGLASIVGASQLVLLTDVDGIRSEDGQTIGQIDSTGIEILISTGVIEGGMIPKARGAAIAANASGVPTVIASWKHPQTLTKLATGSFVGTRVVPSGKQEARALSGTNQQNTHTHSTEIAS